MNIILGVGTLVLVLIVMTLFLNFAPYGKQGLQALSGAACATFLPQAFLSYAIGGVFHIHFFQVIGDLAGSLAGVAVGILTCVNLGISPVFAVIVGLVLHDFKLLPAFIAAYIISFGIKFIEKKVPEGLDLIAVILIAPAVAFGLATVISPGVMAVLQQIGGAITAVALSRKESRDKLKQEYNKYKEDPESYKSSAKDLATQIGNKANETIQEVKKNPKDYVERIKSNPKEFLEEEKSKIIGKNDQTQDDIEEGKFDVEGGATVNNNLRVVTEDDLKNNKNALQDKKE